MADAIPATMAGVHLVGHGDTDQLIYRTDIPTPQPGPGEVLIRVGAAGMNNTDINTRIGWYSKSVRGATDDTSEVDDGEGWSGQALEFPRIQGIDCCGHIVAVGEGVDAARIGERVLVRPMQAIDDPDNSCALISFGSEVDGAFAQYTRTLDKHALHVECDWTDVELASMPCAYATAEGMLSRATLRDERVLITGASGGVGSAAVQLAKRRGAEVIGVAAAAKADSVMALGADGIVPRGTSVLDELGPSSVDVVVDVVGGDTWPELLDVLRQGGRYVTSGAIAGPIVELDLRTLYLRDLSLFGSTFTADATFADVVSYIETDEIRPIVAATYPLAEIARAQEDFQSKRHTGNLVLIPPPD